MGRQRKTKDVYWPDDYVEKKKTAAEAIGMIKRGQRVFLGSSCGEPQALVRELAEQSDRFTDLEIVRVLSLETTPLSLIADETCCQNFNIRSFYLGSAKPRELSRNKRFITPINLSAVPRLFKSGQLPIDVALIQVSEPDDFGWMSMGISVDVSMSAAQSADIVIAQVNANMPRVLGRSFLHVSEVDIVVDHTEPLLTVGLAPELESGHLIARHVAKLIEDGSTLQISLGATPQALLLGMSEKNDLGIHTQYLTDGIMNMVSQGVITNRKKEFNEGKLVAAGAIGSQNLYEFLHDNPAIEFHPSDYVNNPSIIARHHKMVALNVAMAIDITGQMAADALPYNHFSGVSGIMDFVRGASQAKDGKNIIMLPATTLDRKSSRIVPMLDNIAVVVPRGEMQYVATEFGVVNLFGKTLQERAIAMISIAHPDFRDELFQQAKEMGLISVDRAPARDIRSVYPLKVEESRMIDGVRVLFRPARPTDERLIQEHFYTLDRGDVIRRFMHDKKAFVRAEVADVFQVDYVHDMTVLAVTGEPGFERVIAVGGYLREPGRNVAEVAYSVSSDWQRKGLCTTIQDKLVRVAKESGIEALVAYTTPFNHGMIRLFRKLLYPVRSSTADGILTLMADLAQPHGDETSTGEGPQTSRT